MNLRHTLAVLTLGLASSMAMAATAPATPATPATPASKAIAATPATPAKAKLHKARAVAHKSRDCKAGATLVKGHCEAGKKAQG